MARSKSSKQWLKEHFEDEYVRQSKESGLRSRASFKLLEIQEKDKIFKAGMTVVDLGAAPGGWSQIAAKFVGKSGKVIASDILPMEALRGVEFVQGDFTEDLILKKLLLMLPKEGTDLVISDMAPNMTGVKVIDQAKLMNLAELALDLARSVLKPGAYLLVKVFHGVGLDHYKSDLRRSFKSVKVRKPRSSRARSSEIYLLAQGFLR
jgi:23S rRNA (uridine2552-2'-O)-methyltransferase